MRAQLGTRGKEEKARRDFEIIEREAKHIATITQYYWVETYIRDTGTGIQKKDLVKIFNQYFTTKPQGLGTGLGLAVVKDIVEKQHQGRVAVESEWGKGATFYVRLPIQEGIAAKEGDASKEKSEGQPFTFTPVAN